MAASIQEAKLSAFPACVSRPEARIQAYKEVFEENRHRVYSLAFWMTDNEIVAEELTINTFCRAFAIGPDPDTETILRALIAEMRDLMPIGVLTLQCEASTEVVGLRSNIKRIDLERAVMQLPVTERMVFLLHDGEKNDHARIARILGLSEQESACGLHQARLRLRELLAAVV